jgi:succinate dehydrogenase/fumarate reductase-like Fe-S protein
MKITVVRAASGGSAGARHQIFELPDFGPTSISSALQYIARHLDATIGYYLSCRRGLCACCVVRVNGKIETACVVPVSDGMVIEPIRHDLLVADTVVDLSMAREARFDWGHMPGCADPAEQ